MRRDDKGHYAKGGNTGNRTERDIDDENGRPNQELDEELLDRPTTKLIFLISLILWVLTMISPTFVREFDHQIDSSILSGQYLSEWHLNSGALSTF
jgi:hypothetical protein